MKELSKKLLAMQASSVRKLAEYCYAAEGRGKTVYKLNIGQPDLPVPQEYYDRVRAYNEKTIAYMPSNGIPELLTAISEYYQRTGIDVSPDQIAVTTGGTEAVLFTLLALTNPGDEYIVLEPYYSNYNTFFTITAATPVPVTTYAERGFHFKKEEMEVKVTPKTKAIWVTNPGNPTGVVLTKEEMDAICEIAIENDLYIVADEVYREMVFDGKEITSFGFRDEIQDRLILIDSVSKRFNACGARIGAVISQNKEFFSVVSKLCQGRLAVSTIEQYGAVGLYATGDRVYREIHDQFEQRRNVIYDNLKKIPGVVCEKPEGAFYVVCKLPVKDTTDFLIWMLEEFDDHGETVIAAPADGFYATEGLGRDEIRIAYVLEPEKLQRAMEIMAKGLESYNRRHC